MKVIDLLNKIAEGKIIKKVKIDDDVFTYKESNNSLEKLYTYHDLVNWFERTNISLNDEVEIIEEVEDKEYEDIKELTCDEYDSEKKTINQLIRNQKKIIEELKNK